MPRIAVPRIEQSEKRFLAIDEVEHLAETIPPRCRVFVLTGAYTGLRPGELAALRIDRVDLPRRQLRVEEPIKTPAARRTVSFSPFLAGELATHLDTYPGEKNLTFSAPEGGRLDLRVFRRRFWYPAGRLQAQRWSRQLRRHMEREALRPGTRCHSSRHTPHPRRHTHSRLSRASPSCLGCGRVGVSITVEAV